MKVYRFFFLMSLCLVFMACDSNREPNPPSTKTLAKPISLTEQEAIVISNNADFALKLFAATRDKDKTCNIILSPLSLQITMAMAMNGCKGETYDEIMRAVYPNNPNIEDINSLNRKLLVELPVLDEKSEISIVNSIWAEDGESFNEIFSKIMIDDYFAENFTTSAEQSKKNINEWSNAKTKGLIPSLLSENLQQYFGFALLNSIYFKGEWRVKLSPYSSELEFNNCDGTVSYPDFMRGNDLDLAYAGTSMLSMIRIFFNNTGFGLWIILPDDGYDLDEVVSSLSAEEWEKLTELAITQSEKMELIIPKFTIHSSIDFKEILKTMGIKKAFESDEDIDIVNSKKIISQVFQGCHFSIDEQGAEASSASIVSGGVTSMGSPQKFVVDRPFIYMLTERSTNSIIFMGQVTNM